MGEGQHTQRETVAIRWLCPLEALSNPIRGLTENTLASSRQPWGRASSMPETGLRREKLLEVVTQVMGSSTEMGSCVMSSLIGALQVSESTQSLSQCKKITQECCLCPQGTFRPVPHSGLEGTTHAGR